jgi:hypothetical protein
VRRGLRLELFHRSYESRPRLFKKGRTAGILVLEVSKKALGIDMSEKAYEHAYDCHDGYTPLNDLNGASPPSSTRPESQMSHT